MNRFAFLPAVALVFISTSSLAQDAKQTPENAQLFFQQVMAQGNMRVEVYFESNYNVGRWEAIHSYGNRNIKGTYTYPPYKGTGASSSAPCVTTFHFTDSPDSEIRWNGLSGDPRSYSHLSSVWVSENLFSTNAVVVDWRQVAGVQLLGGTVIIPESAKLIAPTVELATRMQFAMEFLRNACDPTASTGF